MKLVLTEKEDILKYIDFLSDEGRLEDAIGEVTLNKEDTAKFLAYFEKPKQTATKSYTQRSWTEEEDRQLLQGISNGCTIPELMLLLGRVEGSVKSRANKVHRKGYNAKHGIWHNLTN